MAYDLQQLSEKTNTDHLEKLELDPWGDTWDTCLEGK